MKAWVKWPGKEFDAYGGGKKISATFVLEDGEEVRVNANNVESPKARFLLSLKRGQGVPVHKDSFVKDGEKIEYWDIDPWKLVGADTGESEGSKGFMDAFEKEAKKVIWFQEQGMDIAAEICGYPDFASAEESAPADLRIAIFERGGAIGTSLLMGMNARGY